MTMLMVEVCQSVSLDDGPSGTTRLPFLEDNCFNTAKADLESSYFSRGLDKVFLLQYIMMSFGKGSASCKAQMSRGE